MKRILILCLFAVPAARGAEEFASVKSGEQVTYPLPPMPLPAVPAQDNGKWAETDDSPALRVSRAWVKLGQAAGGPDGGLSLYSLRRKASLLALRAKVMGAITQRAAARLATEVATQQDGAGMPKSLPSPIAPVATASRRAAAPTSDPYR